MRKPKEAKTTIYTSPYLLDMVKFYFIMNTNDQVHQESLQEQIDTQPSWTNTALRGGCILFSFLCITFGQPSSSLVCSLFTAFCALGLFFLQIISLPTKKRFWAGFCFFASVQAVQLFWFTYHPFLYIWAVWATLCSLMGLQFGLLCLFVTPKNLSSKKAALIIPAVWTFLEWSRLSWFSGFYFDLIGISMTGHLLSLQTASLFGVLGMSFWVMMTNAFFARAWLCKKHFLLPLITFCLPYLFGFVHLTIHDKQKAAYDLTHQPLKAVIVHSKTEPTTPESSSLTLMEKAFQDWQDVLIAIAAYQNRPIDLILMPEMVVPFSSRSLLFPKEQVEALFEEQFHRVPAFSRDLLCSEDIAQACVTLFGCPMIIGLEGTERNRLGKTTFFNSAFFFAPGQTPKRYDKQILVPMGEYIPFDWAKALAAHYGISDSFTPGKEAKLFEIAHHKIGASICYEETFGNLMRHNRQKGATLLVNLTDDYWFPYSKLGIQHFDHARPRSVENGVPMLRACNFGFSGAIDSLGRSVDVFEGSPLIAAFAVSLSSYHYPTLYSLVGDLPLLLLCCGIVLLFCTSRFRKRPDKKR